APGTDDYLSSLRDLWKDYFVRYNNICFLASLSVTFLLVSGIPLNHRLTMWLLTMGMCITLFFLISAYCTSLLIFQCPKIFENPSSGESPSPSPAESPFLDCLLRRPSNIFMVASVATVFLVLIVFIGLLYTIRFFICLFKKCRCCKH